MKAIGCYVYAGHAMLGVRQAGFDILCHLEGDNAYGVSTAKLNWPSMPVHHGPKNWPLKMLAEAGIDFVMSQPPCAIWSPLGPVTTRGADSWKEDPRLEHWFDSFRVLEEVKPRAWTLESVPQCYGRGRPVIDQLTKRALMLGYSITHAFINAQWMGMPQKRNRFFIIAHRPARLIGTQLNWAPPPTVGDVLAEVPDPGYHTPVSDRFMEILRETPPGGSLADTWMRQNPNYAENRNARGNVIGRPSFQDHRLDASTQCGAFVGNKYYSPTEDRALGVNEMKAICGVPLDFKLAPPESGWGSLLARAVMPPVAGWLARAVSQTLDQPDAEWPERRVTLIDVRKPGIAPVDITDRYLDDNGRVRLRISADGTTSWSIPQRAIAAPVPNPALTPQPEPVAPGAAQIGPNHAERATVAVSVSLTPKPPALRIDWPKVIAEQRARTVADLKPEPKEGSGRFIQRLWLTTDLSPEAILELVHASYAGRTTAIGDVRYNYYRLRDAGANPRPWPTTRRVRPGDAPTAAAPRVEPQAGAPPGEPSQGTNGDPAPAPSGAPAAIDPRPRVLITGSTALQCNSQRTSFRNLSNLSAISTGLDALGYNVDWRRVKWGEDISSYAKVVVSVHPPKGLASRDYFLGALWCLLQRPDALSFMDDHTASKFLGELKSVSNRSVDDLKKWYEKATVADFSIVKRSISELINAWRWPMIVPVFEGGKTDLLKLGTIKLVPIDPSSFAPRYPSVETALERERRWVLASMIRPPISNYTWPIEIYGNTNRSHAGLGSTDRSGAVPEAELMKIYGQAWGAISPPHAHPGSGWWRVRYQMAADAGAILSAVRDEAKILGDAYLEASDRRWVERLDNAALGELAAAQRETLLKKTWPRERFLETLRSALKLPLAPIVTPAPALVIAPSNAPVDASPVQPGRRRAETVSAPRTSRIAFPAPAVNRGVGPYLAVTGCTRPQAFPRDRALVGQRNDLPAHLARALEGLGATVDWRPTGWEEPTRNFDGLIIWLAPIISLPGSAYCLQMLRTLAMAHRARKPTVIFYDDWTVETMHRQLGYACSRYDGPFHYRMKTRGYGVTDDVLERVRDDVREMGSLLAGPRWPDRWTGAYPAYRGWGDPAIMERLSGAGKLLRVDPTPVSVNLAYQFDGHRDRRWMMAAIVDYTRWITEQKPTWPVYRTGRREFGPKLPTEADVLAATAASRGTLAPPYRNGVDGTGWYRLRYVYAALGGSVLVPDPADGKHLGPEYDLMAPDVEAMSDRDLDDTAARQRRALIDGGLTSTTRDEWLDDVRAVLNALG